MGFCDKSRMNSDYPPPSSHRPLAWFDVWSQSENYADGLKCFLLLPGWAQYLAQEAQRFLVCLTPQRKPVLTILSPCEHTCLTCLPSGFALCLYPTTKCKLAHIFLRKDICAVMLFSVLRCATTSPICSWNYEVEGQLSLQCGKDTECTKNRTQAFTCPVFISLWFEIIRMDQFWNKSSGYNTPLRFQDYSPQVVSYSIANPVP